MPPRRKSRHSGSKVALKSIQEPINVTPAAPAINLNVPGRYYPADDTLRPHNEHAVDEVYDKAKDIIAKLNTLTDVAGVLNELADLSTNLMTIVKSYPGLQGAEKKVVVLRVIQRVVGEMKLSPEVSTAANAAINYVLPRVIDLLILAADGKLDLGRKWKSTKKAWNVVMGLCCCCAKGKSACTCTE